MLPAWVKESNAWRSFELGAFRGLGGELSGLGEPGKAARARLLDYLEAKYADDADAIAKLDSNDYRALSNALLELGSKRVSGLLAVWVTKGKAWQSLDLRGLADLGSRLSGLGDSAKDAITKVVGHIEAKYLANDAAVASVSCSEWSDLASRFARALSPDSRSLWVGKLRSAYVDDAKMLGGLKSKQVTLLSRTLSLLGDKKSSDIITKWLSAR